MAVWLRRNWVAALLVGGGLLFVLAGLAAQLSSPRGDFVEPLRPTLTPEPIIPTRTPVTAVNQTDASLTNTPTTVPPTPLATATTAATPPPQPLVVFATHPAPMPANVRARFGVTAGPADIEPALALGFQFGSYLSWRPNPDPPRPEGAEFWQMVRLSEEGYRPDRETIAQVIDRQPGSFWIISNEPDVLWQDNVTPERYAELYHELYHFIKERDPSALLVIGGVTQPTPLRLAYLDIILDHYQQLYGHKLPVDVWNVHAFVLREERDSWGVGIPPGMSDELAIRYEIEDHDNMAIFKENLINFRAWMAARGYRDRPLVVTEYGILLPNDYGFPPEAVAAFMTATFDFFLTAVDETTGYPADENRLVQWWFWYSLYDQPDYYPTGNLYDRPTNQLTDLGRAYRDYVNMVLGD